MFQWVVHVSTNFLHLYSRVVSSYGMGRKTKFWNQAAKYCLMPGDFLADGLTIATTANSCKESSSFCTRRCVTVRIHTGCLVCVKYFCSFWAHPCVASVKRWSVHRQSLWIIDLQAINVSLLNHTRARAASQREKTSSPLKLQLPIYYVYVYKSLRRPCIPEAWKIESKAKWEEEWKKKTRTWRYVKCSENLYNILWLYILSHDQCVGKYCFEKNACRTRELYYFDACTEFMHFLWATVINTHCCPRWSKIN